MQRTADTLAPSGEETPTAPGMARLVGQRLRVIPPGYTGLPARDLGELDAKVPQGSRLIWTLAFAPEPSGASLAILGGGAIPLVKTGERWGASTMLTASMLYRIAPVSSRRHRIEAIVDQPPVVTVRTPAKTLSIAAAGQRGWPLVFEATDDYGVAAQADLTITVAAGEGENVSFREHHLTLRGSGDPRQRRFSTTLDLAALGFSGPGDLVAQLTVRDGRNPGPHIVRSPSLILRRLPPSVSEGTGIDGALRATLPAYLRSQRQVIIDTEALLRERGRLSPERFRQRSLAIGEDQAALRLRYGQFLGGEHEMHDTELPTSDPAPTTLGKDDDVLGDFGHKHDEGEAATLFDPETRARLTQAVDQMWQSEGALRGGEPARALPFANRALVLIKQVQQATRVFLAKVGGSELPPIDEARRLTGKRDDIAPVDPGLSAMPADAEAAAAWAAIDGTPGMATNLTPLTRWFRANRRGSVIRWPGTMRSTGCGAIRGASRAASGCAAWSGARFPARRWVRPGAMARGQAARAISMHWRGGPADDRDDPARPAGAGRAGGVGPPRLAAVAAGERSRGWRVALLLLAQPALAVLLYLTLAPPSTRLAEPDVLTVLTRGGTAAGGQTVALPEAGGHAGSNRLPTSPPRCAAIPASAACASGAKGWRRATGSRCKAWRSPSPPRPCRRD